MLLVVLVPMVAAAPQLDLVSPADDYLFEDDPQRLQFALAELRGVVSCTLLIDGDEEKTFDGIAGSGQYAFSVSLDPGVHEWQVRCVGEGIDLESEERELEVSEEAYKRPKVERIYAGSDPGYYIHKVNLPFEDDDLAEVEGVTGNDYLELVDHESGTKVSILFWAPLLDHERGVEYARIRIGNQAQERFYVTEPREFDIDDDGAADVIVTIEVVRHMYAITVRELAGVAPPVMEEPDEPADEPVEQNGSDERNDTLLTPPMPPPAQQPPREDRVEPIEEEVDAPAATFAVVIVLVLIIGMAIFLFFATRTQSVPARAETERGAQRRHSKVKREEVDAQVRKLQQETEQILEQKEEPRPRQKKPSKQRSDGSGVLAATAHRRRRR